MTPCQPAVPAIVQTVPDDLAAPSDYFQAAPAGAPCSGTRAAINPAIIDDLAPADSYFVSQPAVQEVPLILSPAWLSTVDTQDPVSIQLQSSAPASWDMVSGALPPGVSLSSSGVLSGAPTASGCYTFRLRATAMKWGRVIHKDKRFHWLVAENSPFDLCVWDRNTTTGGDTFAANGIANFTGWTDCPGPNCLMADGWAQDNSGRIQFYLGPGANPGIGQCVGFARARINGYSGKGGDCLLEVTFGAQFGNGDTLTFTAKQGGLSYYQINLQTPAQDGDTPAVPGGRMVVGPFTVPDCSSNTSDLTFEFIWSLNSDALPDGDHGVAAKMVGAGNP